MKQCGYAVAGLLQGGGGGGGSVVVASLLNPTCVKYFMPEPGGKNAVLALERILLQRATFSKNAA